MTNSRSDYFKIDLHISQESNIAQVKNYISQLIERAIRSSCNIAEILDLMYSGRGFIRDSVADEFTI